jgi:hypothetical protein
MVNAVLIRRPLRLDHESLAVHCLITLLGSALYPAFIRWLTIYAARFLPTFGHPHAVARRFVHCERLTLDV